MAIDRLKRARESEEARAWAESYDKAERTRLTGLSQARKEGLEQGRKQGRKQGLKEGRERGIEEGQFLGEHSHKIKTARRLIARGCDDAFVAEISGLTAAEIEELRNR